MSSADLNNLSIKNLKKLIKKEYEENKKLRHDKKKEKLIQVYKKLQKQNKKLRQEKSKPKPKPKPKPKKQITTFDDYFQECIKNKSIPKDTPNYLKKALERAMKESRLEFCQKAGYYNYYSTNTLFQNMIGSPDVPTFLEIDSQFRPPFQAFSTLLLLVRKIKLIF